MKKIEDILKEFEANELDGDSIDDCGGAMLNAKHLWEEFIKPTIEQRDKEWESDIFDIKEQHFIDMDTLERILTNK